MGLTILAFILVPGFVALFLLAARRGAGMPGRASVAAISASFAAYSLAQGLVFIFTGAGFGPNSALAFERLSGSLIAVTHILLLVFALNFPTPLPVFLRRFILFLVIPLGVTAFFDANFTFDYIISVYRPWTTIFRIEGKNYNLFVFGDAAIAGMAAIIFAIRAAAGKSRVQRQRSAVAAAFIVVGAALILVSTGIASAGQAKRPSTVFAPAGALLLAGGLTYAFRISRLFDWRAIGRTALGYAALGVAVGLPTGAIVWALVALGKLTTPFLPMIGGVATFIGASLLARLFFARFFVRLSARGDYREQLESNLAAVDLSLGRDAVLALVYKHLGGALDFTDFTVLIDDDQGFMRTVYSPTGGRATIDRASKLAERLETGSSSVILKTEAQTGSDYAEIREPLLELFESLKAEAIIVILEGRRTMGLFALGSRSTGAEYTTYDYDTFRAIYGKLFVIAYYLKNIARESIMTTVDREVALSDQIIRFALEKVERIDHPKADAAWISKSARSLGGDFIDFVRLSKDRWFIVIGDVSGKGLSASMNMLILKSMIRTFLRIEKDFVGLVSRVNVFIKENLPKGTFFAGVFGYIDFSKDAFYYINCGVPAIFMYSPSFDTFIDVQGEGRILGFVKDVSPFIKPRKLLLPSGSALVASTDGLLDSENLRGERYGKERLRRSIRERLNLTSSEITSGAIEDFNVFTDRRQEDDITLLIMKLNERKPS